MIRDTEQTAPRAISEPQTQNPAPAAVKAQLARILASQEFAASERLSDFLRFVVEKTLDGQATRIKAYTIAVSVYGREKSFDPQSDPIVRIHAGRLRRALEHYYLTEGHHDPILIEIPKGRYVPTFTARKTVAKDDGAGDATDTREAPGNGGPSVAILPFTNIGGDEESDHFGHGMAEELMILLTRFEGLSVIDGASSSHFVGEEADLQRAARELGVRFVVTGMVNKQADSIRVTVQLSDARTGGRVWGESYRRELSATNLFEIQDEIGRQVVASIGGEFGIVVRALSRETLGKRTDDLQAYDALLLFYYYNLTGQGTGELYAPVRRALENAVRSAPEFALAWAALAEIYADAHTLPENQGPEEPLREATRCIRRALSLEPECQRAHWVQAYLHFMERDREGVLKEARQTIELNANHAYLVAVSGWLIALAGDWDEGLSVMRSAARLNPLQPGWFHLPRFLDHYRKGEYEAALVAAQEFTMPALIWDPLLNAAALGQLGRKREAKKVLDIILEREPDFAAQARDYVSGYVFSDDLVDRMMEGLKKAGLSA